MPREQMVPTSTVKRVSQYDVELIPPGRGKATVGVPERYPTVPERHAAGQVGGELRVSPASFSTSKLFSDFLQIVTAFGTFTKLNPRFISSVAATW